MDVGIYGLKVDNAAIAFDRAVPGAQPGTVWDDWNLVAVVRLPDHAVIETIGGADSRDWVVSINGRAYRAWELPEARGEVDLRFVNIPLLYSRQRYKPENY